MDNRYTPRPLSASREYPGYQFYARLRFEGHSADECLRYAALTVQNWLCERIQKAGGELPEAVRCAPAAEFGSITSDALHSCRLPFSEIISLPGEGIWSLMVREPHPQIAARSFVTHVGLQVMDEKEVEFGVCIDIVDRDAELPEQDRAYRPQFVRLLFETEGMTLRQAQPLAFRRYAEIRSKRDVAWLKALADDGENQLPLVVFTHARREIDRRAEMERVMAEIRDLPPLRFVGLQFSRSPVVESSPAAEFALPYDAAEFARHIYGYAQACVVSPEAFGELRAKYSRSQLNEGDILIIEPKRFGGGTKAVPYRQGLKPDWYRCVTDDIQSSLQCYSKHKPFRFGNVMFLEDARQRERELELQALRASIHLERGGEQRALLEQLEKERQLSEALSRQNRELRDQMREEYLRGAEHEQQRTNSLEASVNKLRADVAALSSKNETMQQGFAELRDMRRIVGQVQGIPDMPQTNADVVAYYRLIFADRLAFTPRGARTAEKCDINPPVLWSCLYQVATVLVDLYRDGVLDTERRFREVTGWELAVSEGAETRKNPELMNLRKDIYEGREISIEPHVKFHRSSRRTGAQYQRLHYAYDPLTRKIVVGYVGDHLENYLSQSVH